MKLLIVRHGQIDANVKGLIISKTNIQLNEIGKLQAQKLRLRYRKADYDMIITSPLLRTRETADIINKGNEIIEDVRLMERDCGFLEGKSNEEVDIPAYCNFDLNLPCKDGETVQEFFERIWSFLDEIRERYPDKRVMLVTHQGVCRAIHCYFYGIPIGGDLTLIAHNNCQVKKYKCDGIIRTK